MDQYTHRDTARKTLLLKGTLAFEIESPQTLSRPAKKRGFLALMKSLINHRSKNIKAYLSEQQRIYSKIQDKSFILESEKIKKTWYEETWDKFTKNYPPYEPETPFLIFWYLIVLFVLWYNLFEIPLIIFFGQVAFNDQFTTPWIIILNSTTIFILALDIIIKINISYYKHGIIVTNRRKILKNYLMTEFWIDIVALVIFSIYVYANIFGLVYLKVIFYIKCYSIWKYDNQIQKIIELNVGILAVYRLFRVIIIFLIYSHWMACGFFYIDYQLYNNNTYYYQNNLLWLNGSAAVNSMDMIQIFPNQWYIWYGYSLYWALQTATTVGYGDITPKNPEEVLYVIINMIAMCVMFGYFINSVWQILGDYNSKSEKYKKNMSILNRFLINKNISNLLKQKIRAYLDYLWRQDTIEEVQTQIVDKLTTTLKDELTVTIKYPFFLKLRFFNLLNQFNIQTRDNYASLKKELAYSLMEEYFSQDQVIFNDQDINSNLYYLLDGKVKITLKDFTYKGFISTTENFGQYQFITEERRKTKAIVIKYTHVYYLDKNAFLDIIRKYASFYQNYLKLKYKITIGRKLEYINIQCFNCYEYHLFLDCPQIQLQVKPTTNSFHSKKTQPREKYRRVEMRQKIFSIKKLYNNSLEGFQKVTNFDIFEPHDNLRRILGEKHLYN